MAPKCNTSSRFHPGWMKIAAKDITELMEF